MLKFIFIIATLAPYSVAVSSELQVNYSGFSVIKCFPQTDGQLDELKSLHSSNDIINTLDFWTPPTKINNSVHIMAGPEEIEPLKNWLKRLSIATEDMIRDVGHEIQSTMALIPSKQIGNITLRSDLLSAQNYFRNFQRYKTIEAKLRNLEELDSRIIINTIGSSYEGRNIYLVKVSNDHQAKRPVILIDAGHHAREWISHSTLIYLLESLVNIDLPKLTARDCRIKTCRDALNERVKLDLDRFDYWFVPVINPDGYEYSHTVDRLWRKTRSRVGTNLFGPCYGVDPNRNYNFHWREAGASSSPCSEIYAGSSAFSEPETRALASVMLENSERIIMYLSLHAFSQYILTPFGHARVYPKDYADMEKVAIVGSNRMSSLRGTKYEYGPSAVVLYPAAGGSDDYAYGKANIKYAYTVELPDQGRKGFVLPPSEIIPVGHEVLLSVRAMTDAISQVEHF